MKQKIEVEVDVPEGFEATGEHRCPREGEWYLYFPSLVLQAKDSFLVQHYLILRRVEPVKESRWTNLYQHTSGTLCRSVDECKNVAIGKRVCLIRIDYENGEPVNVALEPAN